MPYSIIIIIAMIIFSSISGSYSTYFSKLSHTDTHTHTQMNSPFCFCCAVSNQLIRGLPSFHFVEFTSQYTAYFSILLACMCVQDVLEPYHFSFPDNELYYYYYYYYYYYMIYIAPISRIESEALASLGGEHD